MKIRIEPGRAAGIVRVPPSKSMAHRLLLAAGLSAGESTVTNVALSEDVLATIECLRALGADCRVVGNAVFVRGVAPRNFPDDATLPCRECGSTLRFLIPVCLLSDKTIRLVGSKRLFERPLDAYADICRLRGLTFSRGAGEVSVKGALNSGIYTLPGDVSSQYISGLLFALPLLDGDSEIRLLQKAESRPYIDLTLAALAAFGVRASFRDEQTLLVPGGQRYAPAAVTVEGDASGAAFFGALASFGDDVTLTGLSPDSLQGDRVFAPYLEEIKNGVPTLSLSDCPDLGPILFAAAAWQNGAVFTDTRRLRLKECDRVACMAEELSKCGAVLDMEENRVTVRKSTLRPPAVPISSHGDHRVAMAMAILLTRLGGEIEGCEAVRKSMPDFFRKLSQLHIGVKEDVT